MQVGCFHNKSKRKRFLVLQLNSFTTLIVPILTGASRLRKIYKSYLNVIMNYILHFTDMKIKLSFGYTSEFYYCLSHRSWLFYFDFEFINQWLLIKIMRQWTFLFMEISQSYINFNHFEVSIWTKSTTFLLKKNKIVVVKEFLTIYFVW